MSAAAARDAGRWGPVIDRHPVSAAAARDSGRWGPVIDIPVRLSLIGREGFTINRALAKTITFRTLATTMDFTTNFLVVGDLATAAALSAFGFVVGPFVYLGHEMVWDRLGASGEAGGGLVPVAG